MDINAKRWIVSWGNKEFIFDPETSLSAAMDKFREYYGNSDLTQFTFKKMAMRDLPNLIFATV